MQDTLDTLLLTSAGMTTPEQPAADPSPQPATSPPPKVALSPGMLPQTPTGEAKRKTESGAETAAVSAPGSDVPMTLPASPEEQHRLLVEMCIRALFLCLGRFPQHYKSLYRLAYLYAKGNSHRVSESPLLRHVMRRLSCPHPDPVWAASHSSIRV